MNGVINPEADDYSEFVEVDPTGRYGRVLKLLSQFLSLWLSLFFLASDLGSDSWVPFFFWLFGCSTMKYLERELQRQCTDWALCFAVIFFMPVYFRYLLILVFFLRCLDFFFFFSLFFLKFLDIPISDFLKIWALWVFKKTFSKWVFGGFVIDWLFFYAWSVQLQSIRWVWRHWSCLEPGQALWFPAKPWRSWEALLWNSSP